MHRLILLFFLFSSVIANGQRLHLGVFGGLAAYNGDLTDKIFPKKVTNGAIGITGNYELTDHVMLRAGLTYAIVGGADRFSDNAALVARNLAFETRIFEFSALAEYNLFDLNVMKYTPYAFAGLAVYHYDPYAYNGTSQKIFLKPLSTEGQGIAGYPDRQPYSLTQLAIPFGGGIKFAITENLRIGVELGMRKLFTDYLDDVSRGFIDEADLLAARGQLAVDMSYRADELPGGDPLYPLKDSQRGSEKSKDWYYFTGIHLTYRLGSGKGGGQHRTGCPTNVF